MGLFLAISGMFLLICLLCRFKFLVLHLNHFSTRPSFRSLKNDTISISLQTSSDSRIPMD